MDKAPFLKPIGLSCSIVGLIESLIYTGLAIYGVLIYDVIELDLQENSFGYVLYNRYFNHSQSTGEISKLLPPSNIFIYTCISLAFNAIWLLVSAYCFHVFSEKNNKKLSSAIYSWVTIVITLSLFDLALTILFGLDYNSLMNEKKKSNLTLIAAIFMMCMSARWFILWIINVVLASILLKLQMNKTKFEEDELMNDNSDTMSHISKNTAKNFESDRNSLHQTSPSSPNWHPPINAFSYNFTDGQQQSPWNNKPNVRNVPLKSPPEPHPGWTLRRDQGINQWDIRRSPNHDPWENQRHGNMRPQPPNNHDSWSTRDPRNENQNMHNNRNNRNQSNQMSSFKPKESSYKSDSLPAIPLPDYSPNLPRINRSALRPALKVDSQFDKY